MATPGTLSADEQRLAELGYKQELRRGWSAFSNFWAKPSVDGSAARRILSQDRFSPVSPLQDSFVLRPAQFPETSD